MTKTATTTFKGVELVKVGHWLSAAGAATVTAEHLHDAAAAAYDKQIDVAPIKIGHEGKLELGDAHPAAGWIENIRLSADKQTLLGDLAHIPTKLASIIPRAFRRRSVEMSLGVTTPAGKTYAATLTALSLLGAKAPAVKGLEDIAELYASGASDAESEQTVALSYDDTATVPHGEPETSDAEVIEAPDSGAAKVTDERTAEVALTDALKKKLGLAADATDAEVEAALEAAQLTAPAGEPDNRTDEQKQADADAAAAAAAAAPAGTPAAPAAVPAPTAAPAGTQLSGGTVAVSAVQFSEMRTELETLKAAAQKRDREEVITLALSSGRIAPAEQKHWEAQLTRDHEGTALLLSSLQPRFSTVELGAATAREQTASSDDELNKLAEAAGL